MITGTVTGDREIVIHLEALAADRSPVSIEAVVDTTSPGFLNHRLEVAYRSLNPLFC